MRFGIGCTKLSYTIKSVVVHLRSQFRRLNSIGFHLLGVVFAILLLSACSESLVLSKQAIEETFGSPHIVKENYIHYLGAWGPGATSHKFYFQGDRITRVEYGYYAKDKIIEYIPQLIDSLRSSDPNLVNKARRFLISVMCMTYPEGWNYMGDGYKGTPFDGRKTGYDEWRQWWSTHHRRFP